MQTHRINRFIARTVLACGVSVLCATSASATPANGTIDLLTTPPELTTSVPPNIVLTFDDSGSMGRNYMPDGRPYTGAGWGGTDQQNTSGSTSYPSGGAPFLCAGVIDPRITDPANPRSWVMNGVYYNPNSVYNPPLKLDGITAFPAAPYAAAWDNGIIWNRPDAPDTSGSVRNLGSGTRFCGNAAGYYRYKSTAPDITLDASGNIPGTSPVWTKTNWEWVALPAAEQPNFANWYSYYHTRYMASVSAISRAFAKFDKNIRVAWQNINTRKLAVATSIYAFEDNAAVYRTRTEFYKWLFSTPVGGNTPNQAAADRVGQFYQRATGAVDGNPYWDRGLSRELSCRKNFHIQMTDGLWNNSVVVPLTNDNGPTLPLTLPDGRVYAKGDPETTIIWNEVDPTQNSMADIAFHYWSTDLRPDFAADGLTRLKVRPYITDRSTSVFGNPIAPGQNPLDNKEVYWNPANDPATWPHLVQFMIGLGVSGTIPQNNDELLKLRRGDLQWPKFAGTAPYTDTAAKIDDMWHAAINSRGKFFTASDPAALIRALQEIIASVTAQNTSSTPASLSLPLLTFGTSGYAAGYDSSDWSGKLVREDVDPNTGLAGAEAKWDAGCMLTGGVFDTVARVCAAPTGGPWGGGFPPSARDPDSRVIVTSVKDGSGVYTGAAFRWGASLGTELTNALNQSPLATDFCNPAGTPAQVAACDTFGDERVAYVRGLRTNEFTATPHLRPRSSVLGAVVNASPLYTSSPRGGYNDNFPPGSPEATTFAGDAEKGYAAYQFNNFDRRPIVYAGSNDGMLHAFDASTGVERWAYVPNTLMANHRLAKSTADSSGLVTGVDSSPREADAFIGGVGGSWRTYLVGSLRLGGRGLYAIDVTNPEAMTTEANVASAVKWEFTNGTTASTDGDPECALGARSCASLGYTYDSANVARIHYRNKWVAIVSSGYFPEQEQDAANPADAHEAAAKRTSLLVIDLEDGTLIKELRTSGAPQARPTGFRSYGLSTPVVYDIGFDQVDDLVYAGDLAGNLWRFDISDDLPSNWKVDLMFTTYGGGGAASVGDQPIVFNPTAMRDPVTRGPILVFGTGKYLGRDDRTSAIPVQAFYGIRDYGTDAAAYPIRANQLVTQKLSQGVADAEGDAVRRITGWDPPAATFVTPPPAMLLGSLDVDGHPTTVEVPANGWRMHLNIPLEPGERAQRRAVPFYTLNLAVLYSLIPKSDDPCDPGRRYAIMAIDAGTGGTLGDGSDGVPPGTGQVGIATKAPVPPGDPVQKRGGGPGSLIIPGLPQEIQDEVNKAASPPPWHRGAWRELLDLQ